MVRVGGLVLHLHAGGSGRQAHFRSEARQRPRDSRPARITRSPDGPRSTSRTARRSGMSWQNICARASRRTGSARRDAERRRRQSGNREAGMKRFSTYRAASARGAAVRLTRRSPARSRRRCRTSRSPSTRSCCSSPITIREKQGLVISVANNLMKFYDPDKVAVEIVAFGPGIELLKPDNPNRKTGRKPGRAGRARRHLPQHRRYAGARHRQAAGVYCRRDAGPGRRRADPAADRKRLYAGQAVTRLARMGSNFIPGAGDITFVRTCLRS